MTADVELLPCPWCGGKIEGNVSEGSTFRWRKVDGCCADGPEVRHNTTAPDQGIAEHESRIAAIKAWNTRAATAAQAAEIEALRAEVAEWKRVAAAQAELHDEAEASAERLAEALRLAEEYINSLTPEWYSAGQRVLADIRAAIDQAREKGVADEA